MKRSVLQKIIIGLYVLSVHDSALYSYGLRALNLGLTNFWDGGPLRPKSGWYYINYNQYYHTSKFLDAHGQPLGGVESPVFNSLANISQLLYESNHRFMRARVGFAGAISLVLLSSIQDNLLGFTTSGAGWGDLRLDFYLQWDPIMWGDRALMVTNLDIGAFFPSGKNSAPHATINPGNNTYSINPYWAATVYLTRKWTVAWRLYYIWSSENHEIHLKAGDAVSINYSTEYQFSDNFHAGVNGYYAQQLHDNTYLGRPVPESKERVIGLGPGAFYFFPHDFILLGHLYGEFGARNRTQGFNAVLRLIKYF